LGSIIATSVTRRGAFSVNSAPVRGVNPSYYLFAFSPQTAKVHLMHDHEGHPADTKTHTDFASHVGEPDLVHGYAYPIHGGWRLTNIEHDPLGDPYVAHKVVEALRAQSGPQPPEPCEDCDEPKRESRFRRFHYGLALV
jgi:hypothetical protein